MDGDHVCLSLIRHVAEYKDHYLICTASGHYFELAKAEDNGMKPEHNAAVLTKYMKGNGDV